MPRLSKMKLSLIAAALAMTPALSQAETLRMSSVTSASAKDASIEFKRLIEERTDGDIEIKLFPDNQLGDDRVVVESTIFGDITMMKRHFTP